MGCSSSENRSPASTPSIMKRAPMLPRNPDFPSSGPTIFGAVVASIWASPLIGQWCCGKFLPQVFEICQDSRDTYDRRNEKVREEAPRGARGGDAAAHHGDGRGAARDGRAGAHLDQRDRREGGCAALHRVSPLP